VFQYFTKIIYIFKFVKRTQGLGNLFYNLRQLEEQNKVFKV